MAGGSLELTMGASASAWGTSDDDLPTSITQSKSTRMPAMRLDRASGGTIYASSENTAGNAGMVQAFDDNSQTQWQATETAPTIQYTFAGGKQYTVSLYTLTSAADAPEADPRTGGFRHPMIAPQTAIIGRRLTAAATRTLPGAAIRGSF